MTFAWFWNVRAYVGRMWSATTTHLLAFLVGVQPLILAADPEILAKLKWEILAVGVVIVFLRVFAPPPNKIAVHPDDVVRVDRTNNLISIAPAAEIPASVKNQ